MITFVPSVLVCITTIKIQLKTLLVNYLFIKQHEHTTTKLD